MDGSMGDSFEKASEYHKRTRTTQLGLSQPMQRLQTLEDLRRCRARAGPGRSAALRRCGAGAGTGRSAALGSSKICGAAAP